MSEFEELVKFLKTSSIPTEGNNLLTTLKNLGVQKLDDLELLKEKDFKESGACIIIYTCIYMCILLVPTKRESFLRRLFITCAVAPSNPRSSVYI